MPYTVTMTMSGVTSNKTKAYTHGACRLEGRACFGGGVLVVATEPGGCNPLCSEQQKSYGCSPGSDDSGPLSGFEVVRPGRCYAKLGRVEPTLYASCRPSQSANEDGEPCEPIQLAVRLARSFTTCDGRIHTAPGVGDDCASVLGEPVSCEPYLQFWFVDGIDIIGSTSKSCGYSDRQEITITAAEGDTIIRDARWVLRTRDGVPFFAEPAGFDGPEEGSPPELNTYNGFYYRESKDVPAYVAKVTIEPMGSCYKPSPTFDSPLELFGVVDDDPYSETFGQVTGVDVSYAGSGYLIWQWVYSCRKAAQRGPITLSAVDPHKLITIEPTSCTGKGACIEVRALGTRLPPAKINFSLINMFGTTYGCGGDWNYTLAETESEDGQKAWRISSVSATGGKNWVSGYVTTWLDDPVCSHIERAPSVYVVASGGQITSVILSDGGVFYVDKPYTGEAGPIKGLRVTNPGRDYAKLGRYEPLLKVVARTDIVIPLDDFSPKLKQEQDDCEIDYWEVEDVIAGDVSRVIAIGDSSVRLFIEPQNPFESGDPEWTQQLREAKVFLDIERDEEGAVVRTTVRVQDGGAFFRESKNLPPYVPPYTVDIRQSEPSEGSGAKIDVKIETDTSSDKFGTITDAKILSGGSGYTILGGPKGFCTYTGPGQCGLSFDINTAGYGPNCEGFPVCAGGPALIAPSARLTGRTNKVVTCEERASGDAVDWDGAEITIRPGGIYDPCKKSEGSSAGGCTQDCPDFRDYCIEAKGTDWAGETETIRTDDCTVQAFWRAPWSLGGLDTDSCLTGWYNASGFFKCIDIGYFSVFCSGGKLIAYASGGPAFGFYPEECPPGHPDYPANECGGCTSWSGRGELECEGSADDWDGKTITIELKYDDPIWCEECPPPGTVEVTITRC